MNTSTKSKIKIFGAIVLAASVYGCSALSNDTPQKVSFMDLQACPQSRLFDRAVNYPKEARQKGIQGKVVVRFTITDDGHVMDRKVISSSNEVFNQPVLEGIKQFEGCTIFGKDVIVEFPFTFSLED